MNQFYLKKYFFQHFSLQALTLKTLVLVSFALYVQIKKQKGSIYILVQLESLKATVFDVSHQMKYELS